MTKPCNDCPFVKATPLVGSPAWVEDLLASLKLKKPLHHSCHKTDPKADGYRGGKKARECVGYLTMVMNEFDGTPGRDGVYASLHELIETYLVHWLGKEKVESLRGQKP